MPDRVNGLISRTISVVFCKLEPRVQGSVILLLKSPFSSRLYQYVIRERWKLHINLHEK